MRVQVFQNIARRYAAILGREANVRISFSGNHAFTDGSVINLPNLPTGTLLTKNEEMLFGGYIDHEIGHVRWSFPLLDWKKPPQPTLKWLDNLLEDIRIENLMIEAYPGCKDYLDHLQLELVKKENLPVRMTKAEKACKFLFEDLFEDYRGCKGSKVGLGMRGEPDLQDVQKLIDYRMPLVRTKQDVRDLAQDIYELIKEDDTDRNGKPKQNMGDMVPADRGEAMASIVKEILEGEEESKTFGSMGRGSRILPPANCLADVIAPWKRQDPKKEAEIMQQMGAVTASMRRQVTLLLMSRKHKAWNRGLDSGRLDPAALYKFKTGERNLFKEMRLTQRVNTAVSLVVDWSGSMNRTETLEAMITLAWALGPVPGVKLQVMMATSTRGGFRSFGGQGVGRTCCLNFKILKGFEEPWAVGSKKIAAFTGDQGGTPLGDMFVEGYTSLLDRKEPKRIMWIVTDGDPSIGVGDSTHSEYLLMEKMYQACKRQGIMVLGLDLKHDVHSSLKDYVDLCKKKASGEAMSTTIMNMVREAI